jgi:hypothetical protein
LRVCDNFLGGERWGLYLDYSCIILLNKIHYEETMTKVNYTPEMLDTLYSMYEKLGNEGIEEIARTIGKTEKSIRSKLVREGLYKPSEKSKVKANGPSKKELLREIEKHGFDPEGFEGATKVALNRLLNVISN